MTNAISNRLDVSELDYDGIRNNLKTFLQNQAEFSDYDFEGSGMSVLLDLLAYNTHYLSFNANMLSNELYLDSADIRKNVVALAKQLGYTPTSVTSPMATIDILVNNVPTTTPKIPKITGDLPKYKPRPTPATALTTIELDCFLESPIKLLFNPPCTDSLALSVNLSSNMM